MKRAPSSLEGAFLMISFPEQEKERLSSLFIIQQLCFLRFTVEESCQTCCRKEGKTNKGCHQSALFTSLRKGFALLRCCWRWGLSGCSWGSCRVRSCCGGWLNSRCSRLNSCGCWFNGCCGRLNSCCRRLNSCGCWFNGCCGRLNSCCRCFCGRFRACGCF